MVRKVFHRIFFRIAPEVTETEKQSMAKLMAINQISRIVMALVR